MPANKIENAEVTDFTGEDYQVIPTDSGETQFQNTLWREQLGAYLQVSELAGLVDRKAQFVVGSGYKLTGGRKIKTDSIRGNGLDSLNTILYNAVRTYTIGGDFFAEIIRNKRNELVNLKPLNPGTIKVIANSRGVISSYELNPEPALQKVQRFKPEDILHLAYNRVADQIHGQSLIKKLLPIIEMRREAMNDLRVVFHRYVKPLWVFSVDTDDENEVKKFKDKVNGALAKAENLIVPKDTVDSIERVSIPQFSTLDPLPWINLLQSEFLKAEGIPKVVMGVSGKESEAESKVLYLAWQQVVEFNQMFLEEQLKAQVGLEIELEFPASIAPELVQDEGKDPGMNRAGVTPGKDSK